MTNQYPVILGFLRQLLDRFAAYHTPPDLVHHNNNYRSWDWDLMPEIVKYWDWQEMFLYMVKLAIKAGLFLMYTPLEWIRLTVSQLATGILSIQKKCQIILDVKVTEIDPPARSDRCISRIAFFDDWSVVIAQTLKHSDFQYNNLNQPRPCLVSLRSFLRPQRADWLNMPPRNWIFLPSALVLNSDAARNYW